MCMEAFWRWLEQWQDLVAGLVGAVALIVTVWWTLTAERRRDASRVLATHQALRCEIYQFTQRVTDAARAIVDGFEKQGQAQQGNFLSVQWLEDVVRFVDPVIYPQTAADVGALGDHAWEVV